MLTANQEVEDSIVSFLQSQERVKLLEGSVKETEEALRLLRISFEEGEISFTGIYVVQGQLVSLKDQLAQSKGDVVTSLIGIYKALGGGWEVRCAPQPTYDQWWLGQSGSRSPSLDAKMTRPTDTDVEKSDGEEAFVPPLPAPPVPDQESVPEQDVVPNQVPAKERGPEPADQVEE